MEGNDSFNHYFYSWSFNNVFSRVTTAVSSKTSYLVVGREPGQTKIKKAEQLKTNQIDEDAFLDLIRTAPGKGGSTSKPASPKKSASSR
jgi:replication factor C subunit 1